MVVLTPIGGELIIYDKGTRVGSAFCSAVRSHRYLQHGCLGYLAYVVDTQDEGRAFVSDVHVVREFPVVFLADLSSVPPVR